MKQVIKDTFFTGKPNLLFAIEINNALDWACDTFARPIKFRFDPDGQQIIIEGVSGQTQFLNVASNHLMELSRQEKAQDFLEAIRTTELSRFSRRPSHNQVAAIKALTFRMELQEPEMTIGFTYLSQSGNALLGKEMLKKARQHKLLGSEHAKAMLERAHQIPECLQGIILVFARKQIDLPGGNYYVSCLIWKDNTWNLVRRLIPSDWRGCAIIHPIP